MKRACRLQCTDGKPLPFCLDATAAVVIRPLNPFLPEILRERRFPQAVPRTPARVKTLRIGDFQSQSPVGTLREKTGRPHIACFGAIRRLPLDISALRPKTAREPGNADRGRMRRNAPPAKMPRRKAGLRAKRGVSELERMTGIEPALPAWEAGALTIRRHPRNMLLLISKNIITEAFMICNQKIVVPAL